MKFNRFQQITIATAAAAMLFLFSALPSFAEWNPSAENDEGTLEFYTVNSEGEEHWATVWFVVIDGDAYIRLGARAEQRIRENIHDPIVRVRIDGTVYENITVEEDSDKNDEVAAAMREKYWTAFMNRFMPERYTAKLYRRAAD